MEKDLRKRIEEAAEEHCSKYDFEPTQRNITDSGWEYGHTYTQLVKCFLAGAEFGYKEAIKMVKEWLKNNDHFYQGGSERFPEILSMFDTQDEMLADFEADMNKLWEEKK